MTDLNRVNSGNLDAIRADGTVIPASRAGDPSTWGVTLAAGTTYFFPLGAPHSPVPAESWLVCTGIRWDAAIVVTFDFEACVFPSTVQPQDWRGATDVSDVDVGPGNWMAENPPGAYVSGSGVGGMTATGLQLVVAGGAASGSTIHIPNWGASRARWRAVVGPTGGRVRLAVRGKGR